MTSEQAKEKLYMQWQEFLENNLDYAGISDAYKKAFAALDREIKLEQSTNGDVLLDLLKGKRDCIYPVGETEMEIKIDCEWWNAPYHKGKTNG